MGERLFYLPSAGLCLLIGLAYEWGTTRGEVRRSTFGVQSSKFPKPRTSNLEPRTFSTSHVARRTVFNVLIFLVCVVMTARTMARNRDWSDNKTLFQRTVAVVPQDAKAHALLGHALMLETSPASRERAIEAFQTALNIHSDYFHHDSAVVGNLSALLVKTGRSAEAHELLERMIAADPEWGVMHYFLALHYARTEQPQLAEAEWHKAIALSPHVHLFQSFFSRFLIERGRYAEGLAVAEQVLQRHPDLVLAVFNRALALQALGRIDEAAEAYERVLVMPSAPDAAKLDARGKLLDLRALLHTQRIDPADCTRGLIGC